MQVKHVPMFGCTKTKLGILLLIAVAVGSGFCIKETFAYTATISTSGTVTVDVSSVGNGANVGSDNVVVNSDCPSGYTLKISGGADNKLYRGGDSANEYISPSAGTTASPAIITGNNLGTWGYSLSSTSSTGTFIGLTNTETELTTKNAASVAGGDTIPVYYGVSVPSTMTPGIYRMAGSNAITYYLTNPVTCSQIDIVYNGNNATGSSTMSVSHTGVAENDTVDLYASNYRRDGYGFAGWSTEQINPDAANAATLIANAASNNKIYGPNATITTDAAFIANADSNNIITLYAVWIKPTTDPSTNQPMTLQNWTGCSSMNNGDIIALKDQRDNNAYAVAKLADGNCWMVENLRLEAENSTNESLAQGFGKSTTYGNFIGLATAETSNFTSTYGATDATTANSKYYAGTQSGTATIDISQTNYAGFRMPRYNNGNTNSTVSNMTTADANVYSYGNYYTWSAAMANTGYYNTTTMDANGYTPSEAANTSLCPNGWKLPYGRNTTNSKGTTSGGFSYLDIQLGGTGEKTDFGTTPTGAEMSKVYRTYPNNFLYSGYFYTSSADSRSSDGYYWSSTALSSYGSYGLYFDSSSVRPGTNYYAEYRGLSIRCISSQPYTISYNANGGSGSMSDQTAFRDNSTNLSANAFTAPSGKGFIGWNTAANGSGTSYTDQQSVINLANAGGTITLYAQWGCPGGKICYNANGADAGTMGDQTVSNSDTSITLLASNYSRSGYGFAGWSTNANGTGTLYGPQEDLTLTAGQYASQGLQLYAVWVQSAGNLQNASLAASVCNSLTQSGPSVTKTLNSVSALTDQRDNQTYAIAKLADGNCWMIENLRLEAENSTNESLAQGFGKSTTYGNFSGLATAESANFTATTGATDVTAANSKYYAGTQSGTATINISQTNYAGYRMPRYNNLNTQSRATNPTTNSPSSTVGIYSYGNYYTWSAAMANTIYYSSPTATDADGKTSETVNTSLCPAGWRLPRGGNKPRQSTNDLWALVVTGVNSEVNPANYDSSSYPYYNGTTEAGPVAKKLRSFPNNFLYSGNFDTSSAGNRGSVGRYWSSTAYSGEYSYYLVLGSSSVYPGTNYVTKYRGYSIRCVKEKTLYEKVAAMSKGTQVATDLQATITADNSGVYEYNDSGSVFGPATDAESTHTIYYYRGILDDPTGTYGSDGNGVAYPNYVILDEDGSKTTADTCWRIVRTTGSGGVKMIYNGKWTGNTCANATTSAAIATTGTAFNGTTGTYAQVVRAGYTHNNTYASNDTTNRTLATLFGSNSSYSGNASNSTVKDAVETWFTNNINNYENMLEPNAGYCNDRTLYNTSNTLQNETSVSIPQYSTSTTRYNFGAYVRNLTTSKAPTLGCPRATVDLYTTSSASAGNKQLSKPVALLTTDEASFAGSGSSTPTNGSAYHANSFLRTGSNFHLMSPGYRNTNGRMYGYYLRTNGYLANGLVSSSYYIRPVISLRSGVAPASGSGTAVDPWVITAP